MWILLILITIWLCYWLFIILRWSFLSALLFFIWNLPISLPSSSLILSSLCFALPSSYMELPIILHPTWCFGLYFKAFVLLIHSLGLSFLPLEFLWVQFPPLWGFCLALQCLAHTFIIGLNVLAPFSLCLSFLLLTENSWKNGSSINCLHSQLVLDT